MEDNSNRYNGNWTGTGLATLAASGELGLGYVSDVYSAAGEAASKVDVPAVNQLFEYSNEVSEAADAVDPNLGAAVRTAPFVLGAYLAGKKTVDQMNSSDIEQVVSDSLEPADD